MIHPICGRSSYNPSGTQYITLMGGDSWKATIGYAEQLVAAAGKIHTFRVQIDTAPGVGSSRTYTLYVNEVVTGLSVTISDANTTGEDIVDEISVSPGDAVSIRHSSTGTPAACTYHTWVTYFDSTSPKNCLVMFNSEQKSGFSGTYYAKMGNGDSSAETAYTRSLAPTSGTLKNLYIEMDADVGRNITVTLYKNDIATGLTATITSGGALTANDLVNTVAVAAGDRFYIRITQSDTPTASSPVYGGMDFVPDVDGQGVMWGGTTDAMSDSSTEYDSLSTWDLYDGWGASLTTQRNICNPTTLKNLYMRLDGPPGAGTDFTFHVMVEGNPSTITCTVANAAITGNDTTHEEAIAAWDEIGIRQVPTGTPDTCDAWWGIMTYNAPLVESKVHEGNVAGKLIAGRLI